MNKILIPQVILVIYIIINLFGCSHHMKNDYINRKETLFLLNKTKASIYHYKKVIYFDKEKDEVNKEDLKFLLQHAHILNMNIHLKILLQGHADDGDLTGLNELLSKNRAYNIKQELMKCGVKEDKISTLSHGNAKPAIKGGFESTKKLNRRVEIFYLKNKIK